jgi:hypothetical protein
MYRTIPVSVRNIEVLRELGTLIPPYGTTRIKRSSTVDENDKPNFVVVTVDNRQFTETQLWVRPLYQNYREAWEKEFGIQSYMDVDHIHARERAHDLGYEYIRLALVPASANRSAGAGYEKKLLNAYRTVQFDPHEIPKVRYLDYVQAIKIRGTNIGSSRQGYPGFFQTHKDLIPPRILGSKKNQHGQELPWELD